MVCPFLLLFAAVRDRLGNGIRFRRHLFAAGQQGSPPQSLDLSVIRSWFSRFWVCTLS
jgi:hypothetical protein